MNLDLELSDYDDVIFRIMPRKESRYRFQATYTPLPWVVLGGSLNLLQDSNNDTLTNYVGHNRNYGVTASIAPNERLGIDLAYNYNDVIQNALICFSDTPPIGVSLDVELRNGAVYIRDAEAEIRSDVLCCTKANRPHTEIRVIGVVGIPQQGIGGVVRSTRGCTVCESPEPRPLMQLSRP